MWTVHLWRRQGTSGRRPSSLVPEGLVCAATLDGVGLAVPRPAVRGLGGSLGRDRALWASWSRARRGCLETRSVCVGKIALLAALGAHGWLTSGSAGGSVFLKTQQDLSFWVGGCRSLAPRDFFLACVAQGGAPPDGALLPLSPARPRTFGACVLHPRSLKGKAFPSPLCFFL